MNVPKRFRSLRKCAHLELLWGSKVKMFLKKEIFDFTWHFQYLQFSSSSIGNTWPWHELHKSVLKQTNRIWILSGQCTMYILHISHTPSWSQAQFCPDIWHIGTQTSSSPGLLNESSQNSEYLYYAINLNLIPPDDVGKKMRNILYGDLFSSLNISLT